MSERRRIVKTLPVDTGEGSDLSLTPQEIHYLKRVLRLNAGEVIDIYDSSNHIVWEGELREESVILGKKSTPKILPSQCPISTVYLPFIKGEYMERAVEDLVPFAPLEIHLFEAARSVSKSSENKINRLKKIIDNSAVQSRVPCLSSLRISASLRESIKNETHPLIVGALIFEASIPKEIPLSDKYSLVVGPEGDFTSEEIELLKEKKAFFINLGEGVLRTHLAAIALTVTIITSKKLR